MRNQLEYGFIITDGTIFIEHNGAVTDTGANPIRVTAPADLDGGVRDIYRYALVDIDDTGKTVNGFLRVIVKEAESYGSRGAGAARCCVRFVISESIAAHIGGELSL